MAVAVYLFECKVGLEEEDTARDKVIGHREEDRSIISQMNAIIINIVYCLSVYEEVSIWKE